MLQYPQGSESMTKKEFYKKWLEFFASGISDKDIQKYVVSYGGYIWHIFSWNLLDKDKYLVGEEAKKAYNSINKDGAFFADWDEDDDFREVSWEFYNADSFDYFSEVYVVGKDFSWTYIKTHEEACGPYFMKL